MNFKRARYLRENHQKHAYTPEVVFEWITRQIELAAQSGDDHVAIGWDAVEYRVTKLKGAPALFLENGPIVDDLFDLVLERFGTEFFVDWPSFRIEIGWFDAIRIQNFWVRPSELESAEQGLMTRQFDYYYSKLRAPGYLGAEYLRLVKRLSHVRDVRYLLILIKRQREKFEFDLVDFVNDYGDVGMNEHHINVLDDMPVFSNGLDEYFNAIKWLLDAFVWTRRVCDGDRAISWRVFHCLVH